MLSVLNPDPCDASPSCFRRWRLRRLRQRVIRLAAWAVLCVVALAARVAQTTSHADAPQRLAALLRRIAHRTLAADFVQIKYSPAFLKPMRSVGHFLFAQPSRLRWEYRSPFRMTLIVDGQRASLRYPDLKQTRTVSLGEDRSLAAIFDALSLLLGGRGRLPGGASVSLATHGKMQRAELRWAGGKMVRSLVVVVEGDTLRSIEIGGVSGDRTTIHFDALRYDQLLGRNAFAIE
ncbi:MAG: outer membrane lipoprotein carrier protein LolA [Deltaproteobacteria bacterium]|nr:outer membrane lipoprotein carrier protein LolA [Deltaproteobacteria bacterium]